VKKVMLAMIIVPTIAAPAQARQKPLKQKYTDVRQVLVKRHGAKAAGRNIRRYGVNTKHSSRKATYKDFAKSIKIMRRLMIPLLVPKFPRQPPAGTKTAKAGSTLESIASCESGGNPKAVSKDGTYRGKYQFDMGTWRSVGGTGDPAAASEAEQDRRAAVLHAQRGGQPWPNC
jgi:hypothetical protein